MKTLQRLDPWPRAAIARGAPVPRSADLQSAVAPVFNRQNLPAARRAPHVANLRYGSLQSCATLVALACLLFTPLAQAQSNAYPQAVSREVSVFAGGEAEPPYRQLVSREWSVSVGGEAQPPYRQLVSREWSVSVGGEAQPPYRQLVSREVSALFPNSANLFVADGQVLTLPTLYSYAAPTQPDATTWLQASGPGSILSLPNVTNVVGNARRNGYLRIEALNGGRVNLPAVLTMTQPYDGAEPSVPRGIQVLADGTNSVVDLSHLVRFEDFAATPGSRLEARNGGTILLGGGGELALRQITLIASGQGTLLDVSALTAFEGGAAGSTVCQVQALAGATVRLTRLPEIQAGAVNFLAEGVGSVVDLPALVRFNGGSLEARSGGIIHTPRLFFLDRSTVTVRNAGSIGLAQVRKLTNSRVTVDGANIELPQLFNWTGTTFTYLNGGTIGLPQIDFQLSGLTLSTNHLWCGDRTTVSWQGTNRTGAEVLGNWTDTIYLSADDRWDIGDLLLGTVDQTNGLASNAVYSASADVFVPGVFSGNYHILVRTVAFNLEGTNGPNNTISVPVPVDMPELALGVPTNSVFLQAKHARYWQVVTTEGNDLQVSLDLLATNGATELYLGYGAIPTRSAFNVKYSAPFQPDQVVRVPGTRAGTNYVLAFAEVLGSGSAPFTLSAEYLPFTLSSVTPNHGGNGGLVTMKFTGSGFPSNATAQLVYTNATGEVRQVLPIQTTRPDMSLLVATFDLRGVPQCVADVDLLGGPGQSNRLPQAFRVEPGESENLKIVVAGPSSVRKARSGIYEVTVLNKANQDAQLVSLYAMTQADPNISIELVSPAAGASGPSSSEGFLFALIPVIPPGGQITKTFRVQVGSRYPGMNLALGWHAQTMAQEVFLTQLSQRLEETRQQVLSNTNLYSMSPELYETASNHTAWQALMSQNLANQGFLLVSSLGAHSAWSYSSFGNCAGSANLRSKDCQIDECTVVCGVRCLPRYIPICGIAGAAGGMAGLGVGAVVTGGLCLAIAIGDCFLGDQCQRECNHICTPNPADPNDIRGPIGWGPQAFLAGGEAMSYTIDFENQPSATVAALQVSITNQLAPSLDWKTLEFQEIGFAGMRLAVPAGQNHFEGRVPFAGWTWNATKGWYRGTTPFMVDVKATVDTKTGLLLVTLACSDTNTGTFPSDAYAGFLPPNRPEIFYYPTNGTACCGAQVDTNMLVQPGQGYVSYTVRPQTNLVTGTLIENVASIIFDWNDPIETPTVFNTIDAGAPISSVLPLPTPSGRTFEVQWAGADDFGGSGVANYDVYVSSDGTNYSRWLGRTTETSAWCVGQLGHTYYFYSVARDYVGHEQPKSEAPQAFTTVATNAPVLVVVTNRPAMPGTTIVMTNTLASGKPLGAWRYSLGQGTPSGAEINATNGVFRWTPACSQASQSYPITVWVTDTGNLNLMDATAFTVAVSECVVPSLGRQVLRGGDSGRVPVNLISSVPLTNLAMKVEAAAGRLTNLWIEPIVAQICTSSIIPALSNVVAGSDQFDLSLTTCSNQFLIGIQQVAWLHFTTVSNKPSAFVDLSLDDITGWQADGTPIRNFAPQSGRLVIIGEEPLLECLLATNGLPTLVLYGKPGWNCDMDARPTLDMVTPWQFYQQTTLMDLFQTFYPVPASNSPRFFRAVRK